MASVKPVFGSQLIRGHPLAQGLVGCWLMNEGSGSAIYDLSVSGLHGVLRNIAPEAAWAAGADGYTLKLNGLTEEVLCPAMPALGTAFTIMVMAEISGDGFLFHNYAKDWWRINAGVSQFYGFDLTPPGFYSGVTAALPNQTNHYAVTYENGVGVSLYLNGLPDGPAVAATGSSGQCSATRLFSDSGVGNALQGRGSRVMAYRRTLSASEIASLYADPYQMFERPGWRRYCFMSGRIWTPTRRRGDPLARR